MNHFKDKVAVITGAASGIGLSLAKRCCREKMKVVLADVEEGALRQAETDLKATGAAALAVRTDVSKLADIEALARKTLETFGAVHLLFNNAGVGAGTTAWESTQADWEWTIGVNLWGVIHGLRVFVPIMLRQATDCHVVNTASVAGLISGNRIASYTATKYAVVGISEQLHRDLAEKGSRIKVSVLCPGFIRTRILEAARNRPTEFQHEGNAAQAASDAATRAVVEGMRKRLEEGFSSDQAAEEVFQGICEEKLYLLVNAAPYLPRIQARMEDILHGRNPTYG
jgi:NAD(P)-dependent dehydrogenase (short-subunit alcohol dehydrogenase family)